MIRLCCRYCTKVVLGQGQDGPLAETILVGRRVRHHAEVAIINTPSTRPSVLCIGPIGSSPPGANRRFTPLHAQEDTACAAGTADSFFGEEY